MKKNDLILIGGLLIIAFAIFGITRIWQINNTDDQARVQVTIEGEIYGTFSLDKDYEEKIELSDGRYNTLVIKDGEAYISEASCPDKICVHHHSIHYNKETIVCLPNKVVIEIVGGQDNEVDAIAN